MGKFIDWLQEEREMIVDVEQLRPIYDKFVRLRINDEIQVLRGAGKSSKEYGVFSYYYGRDARLGEIDRIIEKARKSCHVIRQKVQEKYRAQHVQSKLAEAISSLDQFSGYIEYHGHLHVKKSMMERIFLGNFNLEENNRIPLEKSSQQCNWYGGKHFGKGSLDAKFATMDRYLVKAMEDKAVAFGLQLAKGESAIPWEKRPPTFAVFRFDDEIGWDGWSGPPEEKNTRAIRVDGCQNSGRHSHPLVEKDGNCPSFHTYVVNEIINATRYGAVDRLADIARFLKICGASHGEFAPSGSLQALWDEACLAGSQKFSGMMPEMISRCVYWSRGT